MSLAGNVDLLAGRIAEEFVAVRQEIAGLPTGGGLGGVLDCSGMATASEINEATESAPAGTTVWLGARPSGAELQIDETLIIRPSMAFIGAGGRERLTRLLVTSEFPAGDPVVAAQGYLENATVCDQPVVVRGIDIDCDGKVGSDGLVVFHFWSLFDDIQVRNCTGDGTLSGTAAIRLANRGADGETVTTNSHSENVLRGIRISASAQGATGIVQESYNSGAAPTGNNGQANQDGHILGLWIANDGAVNGGRGLDFARAAGWTMRDVHMYGIGDDGARLFACYATDLDGWYIENYGNNDATSDNYAGLQMELLQGRGSTLSNVKITSNQVDSPQASNLRNFHIRPGSAQNNVMVTLVGCHSALNKSAAPTSRKTQAWRFGESGDTGRSMIVRMAGCITDPLDGFMSPARYVHSTVTIDENGTTLPRTQAFSATPTIDPSLEGERVNITATGNITALNVNTSGARDGQLLQVSVLASGAERTITLHSSVRVLSGLSASYTVPSGQLWRGALRYSSLLSAWVLEAAGVTS